VAGGRGGGQKGIVEREIEKRMGKTSLTQWAGNDA